MDPASLPSLPSTLTGRPRTYFLSGSLGVVFFTVSGVFWDPHPFLGSLFLELGGGAFIVFLLEFLLPSFLGYADSVLQVLRTTELVWTDNAVEVLVTDYVDDAEFQRLLDAVARGRYPARGTGRGSVAETGDRAGGRRVLAKDVPVGPTTLKYYVSDRSMRRKTVVIVGLERQLVAAFGQTS